MPFADDLVRARRWLFSRARHVWRPSGRGGSGQPYTDRFFAATRQGARRSAEIIVPLVCDLVRPSSVVDVGCGLGTWLAVFQEHGVEEILGIDGSYVNRDMLEIPARRFQEHDLTKRLNIEKNFDLVVSLEVAEHLPSDCAEAFIDSLVGLGPVVLFSAAIPLQPGTDHINSQWPEFWARLFGSRGYLTIDCLRRKIWADNSIMWWYAQNTLLFAERDYIASHQMLKEELDRTFVTQLSIVHPRGYYALLESASPRNLSTRKLLSLLPAAIGKALRGRGRRLYRAVGRRGA